MAAVTRVPSTKDALDTLVSAYDRCDDVSLMAAQRVAAAAAAQDLELHGRQVWQEGRFIDRVRKSSKETVDTEREQQGEQSALSESMQQMQQIGQQVPVIAGSVALPTATQ